MPWLHELWNSTTIVFLGATLSAIGAIWASNNRAGFERELRAKSEEIATLNKRIAETVTGGDSYCQLILGPRIDRDRVSVMLIHKGEHPLYDLSVRVVDLERLREVRHEQLTLQDMLVGDVLMENVGNLIPKSAKPIGEIEFPAGQEKNFNIFFAARNGFFTELLRTRIVEGELRQARKVLRRNEANEEVTLLEEIDDKFPRGEDGSPLW